MPAFTPPTSLRNPPVLTKQRSDAPFKYYKGTLKAPNVFVWSDGRVAENYNPPTDRATYEFLGGHDPVGVTDQVAGWLLTAGYTLTPDDIPLAEVSGGNILVTLPVGQYSRGVAAAGSASIDWSVVDGGTQSGTVAWTYGASSVSITGVTFNTGTLYTISLTPKNSVNSGNTYQFTYQA